MTLLEFCETVNVFIQDGTSVTMGLDSLMAVVGCVAGLKTGL